MLKKIVLLLGCGLSVFAMHIAEININDKDLEASLKLDLGQFNDAVEPDTTYLGISYLKADEEHSENGNGAELKDTGYFFELNFLIKQEIKKSGFFVGLGVKSVFASMSVLNNDDNEFFMSIPIGLEAGYKLPFKNIIPIYIDTKVYYAPESLSFNDSRSYLEYRLEVSAEVIKRGTIYLGFRNIDTNYMLNNAEQDVTYNQSGYFGFKFAF